MQELSVKNSTEMVDEVSVDFDKDNAVITTNPQATKRKKSKLGLDKELARLSKKASLQYAKECAKERPKQAPVTMEDLAPYMNILPYPQQVRGGWFWLARFNFKIKPTGRVMKDAKYVLSKRCQNLGESGNETFTWEKMGDSGDLYMYKRATSEEIALFQNALHQEDKKELDTDNVVL